jgi:hypothetical protein
MGKLKIIEADYSELASLPPFANMRVGIKIQTTEETYEEDFSNLIIEVKTKLNGLIVQAKEDLRIKEAQKAKDAAIKVLSGEKK